MSKRYSSVKVSEICNFIRGITFTPKDLVSLEVKDAIACFRTKNVQQELDLSDIIYIPMSFVKNKNQILINGDILISNANSKEIVGKCCYVDNLNFQATLGGFITAARAQTEKIMPRYLYYWMSSSITQTRFRSLARQTTNIANLPMSLVGNLEIPLPILAEQERIVRLLDEADALRKLRSQANERMEEFVPALFHKMFGNIENKEWKVSKIEELTQVRTGGTPSRKELKYFDGNIPWVKTTEVNQSVITDTEEKISEEALKNSNCEIFPPDTILIAMYGQGKTRGRTGKLGISATTNQACAAILPSNQYNTDYLWILLQMSYEKLRSLGHGGNQPNLNLSMIKNFKVTLPPLDLQREFAQRVQEAREVQSVQAQSAERVEALYQSMLSRAFAGDL